MNKSSYFNPISLIKYGLISLALILINLIFPLIFIKEASLTIFGPLNLGTAKIVRNLKGIIEFGQSLHTVFNKNLLLQEKINSLESRLVDQEKIQTENDLLKKELQVQNSPTHQRLLVEIQGWQSDSFGQHLIINMGKENGVTAGMPLVYQNILIGVVDEVYEKKSAVEVVTSAQSSIAAMVFQPGSDKKPSGMVEGEYGVGLRLKQVSQDDTIAPGSIVVTSGKGGNLPSGMLLGEITEIFQDQNKVYQEAKVVPSINFEQIDNAFLIMETQF